MFCCIYKDRVLVYTVNTHFNPPNTKSIFIYLFFHTPSKRKCSSHVIFQIDLSSKVHVLVP